MLTQSIDELKEEGRIEGIEQGIEQERLKTVKKMLSEGLEIKMISQISGLSISEIKALESSAAS